MKESPREHILRNHAHRKENTYHHAEYLYEVRLEDKLVDIRMDKR